MVVSCRICGGKLRESSISHYHQCDKCGIMIRKKYMYGGRIEGDITYKEDIFHRIRLFITERRLRKVLPPRKLRILEIGFGSGVLLSKFAKEGHICWGIEPDITCVNSLSQKLSGFKNVTLLPIALEDAVLPQSYFDFICMLHVVEHLHDPYLAIKKIKESLRQDGLLFITTPNTESYGVKFFKEDWWPFEPTHHQLFNPNNIQLLLKSMGFQYVKVKKPPILEGLTTDMISLLRRLKIDGFHPHRKHKFLLVLLLILLSPLVIFMRAILDRSHSNMMIIAKIRGNY